VGAAWRAAPVTQLRQSFRNATDSDQIINLEPSSARFRLAAGAELLLLYDSADVVDDGGAALSVEFARDGASIELIVWTFSDEMFFADGREAPRLRRQRVTFADYITNKQKGAAARPPLPVSLKAFSRYGLVGPSSFPPSMAK
jgi:hypothetical protein